MEGQFLGILRVWQSNLDSVLGEHCKSFSADTCFLSEKELNKMSFTSHENGGFLPVSGKLFSSYNKRTIYPFRSGWHSQVIAADLAPQDGRESAPQKGKRSEIGKKAHVILVNNLPANLEN